MVKGTQILHYRFYPVLLPKSRLESGITDAVKPQFLEEVRR